MTGRSYIFTQTTILTCLKGGHKETLRSPMLFCGYKVGHHLVNLQSLRAKYEQLMRYNQSPFSIFHHMLHPMMSRLWLCCCWLTGDRLTFFIIVQQWMEYDEAVKVTANNKIFELVRNLSLFVSDRLIYI